MVYQFDKIALALISLCVIQTGAVAGNGGQLNVGLVITQNNAIATRNRVAKFTCNAAKIKISMRGYQSVEALTCDGNVYHFLGQAHSKKLNINFNAITGQISVI